MRTITFAALAAVAFSFTPTGAKPSVPRTDAVPFAEPFGSAEQPDKKDPPKPLPDKIIKAWKDAGATAGWIKIETSGIPTFIEKPEAGALPAFRFPKWKDGVVAKLPLPESPIGLDLSKTEVTDSGLKELADLKTLTSLTPCETKVTEDAVEKLRKILPKCFIFHC